MEHPSQNDASFSETHAEKFLPELFSKSDLSRLRFAKYLLTYKHQFTEKRKSMEQYIKNATAQFETLLREQLARCEKMKEAAAPTDFANADKIVIGIVDGDGNEIWSRLEEE